MPFFCMSQNANKWFMISVHLLDDQIAAAVGVVVVDQFTQDIRCVRCQMNRVKISHFERWINEKWKLIMEDEWCHKDRHREIRATKMTMVIINCGRKDTLTLSLTSVISTARKEKKHSFNLLAQMLKWSARKIHVFLTGKWANALQTRFTLIRCFHSDRNEFAIVTFTIEHFVGWYFASFLINSEFGSLLIWLLNYRVFDLMNEAKNW